MRSVMLVAASLAFVGQGSQQQFKFAAEQVTEKPYGPHLNKLATLLLASNSMSAGTHFQTQMQQRKMAEMQPTSLGDRISAFCHLSEAKNCIWSFFHPEAAIASEPKEKLSEMYGGASEEGEKEIGVVQNFFVQEVVQKFEDVLADVQLFPNSGPSRNENVQTFPRHSHKQEQNPTVGLTWGLADEKRRTFGFEDSIQAEVEFLRSQEQNPDTGLTWGLGDEKGHTFGGSTGL